MTEDMFGHMFEEYPEESECDVAIIGAGPNGLMAGTYLASAGLNVILCERRYEIGGGLATDEIIYPLYSSNPHVIYHMLVDLMPILRDFNMDGPSLQWIKPNQQTGIVFEDGTSIQLCKMLADSKDSITKHSIKDAETFGRLSVQWGRVVNEIIGPATFIPPMAPIEISMAMQKTEVGQQMLELVEQCPYDMVMNNFENEKVRTLILYCMTVWGLDPKETGVGMLAALYLNRMVNKNYCYGGSHKFASALAREFVKQGGLILEHAPVDKVIVENGKAVGVHLTEGRTIRSKVVMSTLDPQTTWFDLVGKENMPQQLIEPVEGWKYDKWSFNTLHVVTNEIPQYKSDDPWINDSFLTIFGAENTDQLMQHWENVVGGKIDMNNFAGHATCQSLFDPFLSDIPGRKVSFFQMHAPYDIEGGWEQKGPELKEAIMKKWARFAPNMSGDNIIAMSQETPPEIEVRFPNMRFGGIKHGDYKPIQLGCFRPNQDCSSTATPMEGLYTCGASNYPGGLVLGGPGYLGANKVAEDLGANKWWKPTPEMDKYIKTYLEGGPLGIGGLPTE